MALELRWLVSQSASCFHAVSAIQQGLPLADERLAEALAVPAQGLLNDIRAVGLSEVRLLRHLCALAPGIHNNRELAQVALKKVMSAAQISDSLVGTLAGRIGEIEKAFDHVYPKLVDDLALRSGPIREQWESRGPGLLKSMAGMTDERLLVPNADVIIVHPALGGGGAAHLLYNSVRLEGVLVNPQSQLPEVVRLAWLLGQLNTDLPMFGENIHADRLPLIAALALIPPTLAAGEFVELTRCDGPTLELALKTWQIESPDLNTAEALLSWWETLLESKPRWDIALQALDRMLL